MKYENAKDLLPPNLLSEVQKYASGKLMYVPIAEEAKGWGTASGYRQKLLKRNPVSISEREENKCLSGVYPDYGQSRISNLYEKFRKAFHAGKNVKYI